MISSIWVFKDFFFGEMAWLSYFDRRRLKIFFILHLSSQKLNYTGAFTAIFPKIIAILAFLAF